MSKITRKKSSKSASGRSAGKTGSAKATTGGAAAKKVKTRKVPVKPGTKPQTAKSKPSPTTAAKAPARSAAKAATVRTTAQKKKQESKREKRIIKDAALNEGDRAPSFSLPRDGGQLVSLANYTGRKLVIFFYPRADTPGCTLEAIAFSRLADDFAAASTAVLGVSADPLKAQESFRDKHDLTVPLVSDETLEMLKAYGVWGEKSMYGKTFMGIIRTTVLVGADGGIARIWRNVRVDGHADAVLATARAA